MWHVNSRMSTKKKSTPQRRSKRTLEPRKQWKGSIPTNVLEAIQQIADHDERNFNVTLVRLLKESLQLRGALGTVIPVVPTSATPQVPKIMTDAYHRQQQGAPTIQAPPKDKMTEIAYSDEGFEGSDPKTLLAGTKVKI